jgi:hypothetical protein
MGRTGHPVLALGTAAIVVAAVGTSVALTRDDVPIAKAPTTVAQVHGAVVVSVAGASEPARNGARIPNGAVVRTGRHGSAELVTRGRTVYVSHSAAIEIVDGAHQQLRTGTAVYDAVHGDGLRVDVAGDQLIVPTGSAIEAQRSVAVQIGALSGPAQVTSSTARQVTVRSLTQAVLNGDALSASTSPLHLDDGVYGVARAVPDLVDADLRLKTLAAGIDATGAGESSVISATWHGPTAAIPHAAPRSEQVLPIVIADATSTPDLNAQQRYQKVVTMRAGGGSWAVVLADLRGNVSHVENTLTSLQKGQPNGLIGRQVAVQALVAPNAPTGNTHTPDPGHSTHPTAPPSSSHPSRPPAHGTPKPTPSSSPVKKVLGTVVGTVGGIVNGILGTPAPSSTKSGGLLGGLLGH